MPFEIDDLHYAYLQYRKFVSYNPHRYHERYIFPFFAGSYFAYRLVDVARVISIAYSISRKPTYVDIGCGYGDFLEKIREYLPNAKGVERNPEIFYACNRPRPDFIDVSNADWDISEMYDIVFVGWMEPGVDFRDRIASKTEVVVTTIDQGLSLGAEYDGLGFDRIASWRTPSWDDVNTEIMNRYYTSISEDTRQDLAKLRSAHNLWYVYCKPSKSDIGRSVIKKCIRQEAHGFINEHYEFESVMDDCGFRYHEELEEPSSEIESNAKLWEIRLIHTK
jgi:hypothetical protein